MKKSTFQIKKMDCPSEENLIRMKLDGISGLREMEFDIANRKLDVFHEGDATEIEQRIDELSLDSERISTVDSDRTDFSTQSHQKKLLWTVLAINFVFFVVEMTTGLISRSMGLVADSLDMLADSVVYGLSLLAVAGSMLRKKRIATAAGYFQILLAVIGFAEVVRRFIVSVELPDFTVMIYVSIAALIGNAVCLYLLQKSKGKEEAHMQASMIFTSNDIIINGGVIIAGLLVNWLKSGLPDLIIGSIVFILVIRGAVRILKLGK
ncbi:cation transporter [Halocola ammonii]